jgi:dTMP kinase
MTATFITFEGCEGSGKTTQIRLLSEVLTQRGMPHIVTREPGGTEGAEAIRALVTTGDAAAWSPLAEALLFAAARADHIEKRIIPALQAGQWVLCDRFFDSTLVYQGVGKGLGTPFLMQLHHLLFGNFKPDLTLLLDIQPDVGLARAVQRHGDETRFESMGMEFHHAVRDGFLALAAAEADRIQVIKADNDEPTVHISILRALHLYSENPGMPS